MAMRHNGFPRDPAGWTLAALVVFGLSGCASRAPAPLAFHAPPPCAFATCKTDTSSLAKVTAVAVGADLHQVAVIEAQPQFNGAVMIWRATVAGKPYVCRQGRDPATGSVHYVTCQPSHDKGPLKAFP
jgi:hypothetical protein